MAVRHIPERERKTAHTSCMEPSWELRFSKAQVMALAGRLHHDEDGIKALVTRMTATCDPRVAYNAAWVLSHLSKEDKRMYLLPHYEELVDFSTSESLCLRRRLALSILANLPANEPSGKLLNFCLTRLADPKERDSSRAMMIKLAANMCKPYPELRKELALHLSMIPQESSPSITAAKKKALQIIQQ